jgi:hypothetical protein
MTNIKIIINILTIVVIIVKIIITTTTTTTCVMVVQMNEFGEIFHSIDGTL